MKPAGQPYTLDEALEVIASAFNEPPAAVRRDTRRDSLAGWDSMGVLMLTAELDERFGVELSSQASSAMASVEDILEFLRTHRLLRE